MADLDKLLGDASVRRNFLAKIEDQSGSPSFGSPSFTLAGNTNFYFNTDFMRMASSLLPLQTLSWREITPDIEPAE